MWKIESRFFLKNFCLFLVPLLIPLSILGTISTIATGEFVQKEINKNNLNLLKLTRDNLELIFNEMDSLNLVFSTNPEITIKVKKILNNPEASISLEEYDALKTIKNFLDVPANSRSYIHSIYVYYNNPRRRLIATTEGLMELSGFYDTSWYESYIRFGNKLQTWTEPRIIRRYAFEKSPTHVLTIYRRLYTSGNQNAGVMVLNIQTKYIEHLLESLGTFPNQSILIVDESNRVIFKNRTSYSINESLLKKIILTNPKPISVYQSSQGAFTVSSLSSKRYLWKYISAVPQQTLYQIPIQLQKITLLLLVFSFLLGLALTYWLTRKNQLHLQNIFSIISAAKSGSPLPPLPDKIKDEYGLITYNLLTTFIEQNYLKLQLSERKYKLQVMELLALQSQINPHFLFNTLETIKWKIIGLTRKPNETSVMLENLSDILKYSLGQPEQTVSLAEEIRYTCNYLNIVTVLYRDKFYFRWDYDEEDVDYPVIRLLFQPLIENSIYHGIKEKDGQSGIKIKIHRQSQFLKIAVIDNGLGMKPEELARIRELLRNQSNYRESIGLGNTKKRLELTFGGQIIFKLNSKFNFGTTVTIKIPLTKNIINETKS